MPTRAESHVDQNAVTGLEMETLLADFNDVIAFQRIEEFIYFVVKVAVRTSLLMVRLFHDKESAAGFLGQNLVSSGAKANGRFFSSRSVPSGTRTGLVEEMGLGV